MIGGSHAPRAGAGRTIRSGPPRLEIDALTSASRKAGEPELRDVTFEAGTSEILGVAEIEGDGHLELL